MQVNIVTNERWLSFFVAQLKDGGGCQVFSKPQMYKDSVEFMEQFTAACLWRCYFPPQLLLGRVLERLCNFPSSFIVVYLCDSALCVVNIPHPLDQFWPM